MSLAVQIDQHGGPEVMKLVDVTVGEPGPGEIRIRHKAIGLNYIDVYQRAGLYKLPMPLHMGMEASGVIEAVGEGGRCLVVVEVQRAVDAEKGWRWPRWRSCSAIGWSPCWPRPCCR